MDEYHILKDQLVADATPTPIILHLKLMPKSDATLVHRYHRGLVFRVNSAPRLFLYKILEVGLDPVWIEF